MTDATDRTPILTFRLGERTYGLLIDNVIEVAAMVEWIPMPGTRPELLGVVNRHESILPLIDLRILFGLPPSAPTIATLFIVVHAHQNQLGLVVDEVLQVEYVAQVPVRSAMTGPIISHIVNHRGELIQLIALEPLIQMIADLEHVTKPSVEVEGSHEP